MSSGKRKHYDLEVIVELLDNKGYTNKELAEKTHYPESRISPAVKKLRMEKIVHREEDEETMIVIFISDLKKMPNPKKN